MSLPLLTLFLLVAVGSWLAGYLMGAEDRLRFLTIVVDRREDEADTADWWKTGQRPPWET